MLCIAVLHFYCCCFFFLLFYCLFFSFHLYWNGMQSHFGCKIFRKDFMLKTPYNAYKYKFKIVVVVVFKIKSFWLFFCIFLLLLGFWLIRFRNVCALFSYHCQFTKIYFLSSKYILFSTFSLFHFSAFPVFIFFFVFLFRYWLYSSLEDTFLTRTRKRHKLNEKKVWKRTRIEITSQL